MNILFITGYYPPRARGGGELSTHYIAQGLRGRGHNVTVICEADEEKIEVVGGVSVRRLRMDLTGKPLLERRHARGIAKHLLRTMAALPRPARKHGFDVIHAHDFRSTLVLSELTKHWKSDFQCLVVTVRDYAQISGDTNMILSNGTIPQDPLSCRSMWNSQRLREASALRKLFRFWQYAYNMPYRKRAFLSIPHHIYISHAQLALVKRHQNLSNIHTEVIYNPAPPHYVSSPTKEGVPGNILYIGRVEMYKGVQLLLEAMRTVVQKHPHAHLTIVGDGAQRRDYEKLAESSGLQYNVSFKGTISWDRMQRVYDEASVIVLPHLWVEPFGRTVVEGMARGKVVVAANHGGPAEIIQDGVSGLLFTRGDADSLIQRLHDALSMNAYGAREVRERARAWVAEHLSVEAIAKQYEEYYRVVRGTS